MEYQVAKREWLWTVLLIIISVIWLIPLVFMISMSFRTAENAFEPVLFIAPFSGSNYTTVFSQNPLALHFFNSVVITAGTVFLVAAIASMAVFGLTRKDVKYKKLIYNMLMITLMVPISALVIPLTQINARLHWLNTYQGLILPYAALGVPFAIVILKGFMDSFPRDLEHAATVDGCGNWRLFLQIVLPVLQPGLIVIIIWQFLTTWNEFFLALVTMNEVLMKPLTLIPMQYQGFYFSQPGCLFAILVVISIPMIVFYIFVQKSFVKGLMSGAVKG